MGSAKVNKLKCLSIKDILFLLFVEIVLPHKGEKIDGSGSGYAEGPCTHSADRRYFLFPDKKITHIVCFLKRFRVFPEKTEL